MSAYYDEHDPFAAAWLRNLIEQGLIAPGIVDERSIEDVTPTELLGFVQCHFFAGIGIWSAALRGAGWPDDRPVWTGSCPCQPFSTAGKGAGFADERHLWPAWLHLIKHGKSPAVPILGEQVASDDGLTWLDTVRADLEGEGFEVRPVDLCAAGVGAPHIRQRLFFVGDRIGSMANTGGERRQQNTGGPLGYETADGGTRWNGGKPNGNHFFASDGAVGSMADARCFDRAGRGDVGDVGATPAGSAEETQQRERLRDAADDGGPDDGMADAGRDEPGRREALRGSGGETGGARQEVRVRTSTHPADVRTGSSLRSGPVNGFWRAADWLLCKDDRWRPVEPGTQPLAHGAPYVVGRMQPRLQALGLDGEAIARILGQRNSTLALAGRNRTGRLKGYGNAINKEVAQTFIQAVIQ